MDVKQVNSADWWDEIHDAYLERDDLRIRDEEFSTLRNYILGGPVLEIGPAFGEFTKYLDYSIHYLGLDICPKLIDSARERHPNRIFVCGNALNLEKHQWDKAFKHTVAMQVLEHFTWPDFNKIMQNIKNVTKHSLIFSVPKGEANEKTAQKNGHLIGWQTEEELVKCFSEYGLVVLAPCDENHIVGALLY